MSKTPVATRLTAKALLKRIEEQLIIDAVEVVRCRDCEWWRCNPNTEAYGVCKKVSYGIFEVVMACDDFCSYGLRRKAG